MLKSLLILFLAVPLFANSVDQKLETLIKRFRLKAIEEAPNYNQEKYQLGMRLFADKRLSGNKDVSCATCHSPAFGTGDGLPLSIGVRGVGLGTDRVASGAPITPRHAPHLFNMAGQAFMFWDGRVAYDGFEFLTPEPGLNGHKPKYDKIAKALDSALAAQALFPPLSQDEMLGKNNDLSKLKNNYKIWEAITKRITSVPEYLSSLKEIYPNESQYNIGHIASSIAHFQEFAFAVTRTPWDRYLRGDLTAMDIEEKKGAIMFLTKARCINCHSGSQLGGSSFQNIASPQIGPGLDINHNDEGRFLITGRNADLYKFKVPSLRNVVYSAPYFHSGAYNSLEDVINHYAFGTRSLDEYSDDWLRSFEIRNYGKSLYVERNPYMLFRKKENSHPLMRNHKIRLTNADKAVLLKFLKISLSQTY